MRLRFHALNLLFCLFVFFLKVHTWLHIAVLVMATAPRLLHLTRVALVLIIMAVLQHIMAGMHTIHRLATITIMEDIRATATTTSNRATRLIRWHADLHGVCQRLKVAIRASTIITL